MTASKFLLGHFAQQMSWSQYRLMLLLLKLFLCATHKAKLPLLVSKKILAFFHHKYVNLS